VVTVLILYALQFVDPDNMSIAVMGQSYIGVQIRRTDNHIYLLKASQKLHNISVCQFQINN